ncbi:MAG: terminase small subunit [Sterolibacterium sp.]|nr:terminase small subunit [Sterolibacterium sp.]
MSILKNARHEHFAHLCAKGVNPTEAYIAAGFSPNGASTCAARLLQKAPICARVAEIRANINHIAAEKSGVDLAAVLQELKALVHADPRKVFAENGDLLPVKDWPDDVAAMIASIEIEAVFEGRGKARKHVADVKKVKFWDKNSAIEKAMKHLGAFEQDNKQKSGVFEGMPHEKKKAALALIQEELTRRENGTVH